MHYKHSMSHWMPGLQFAILELPVQQPMEMRTSRRNSSLHENNTTPTFQAQSHIAYDADLYIPDG